jgi:predicted nucleic acid-binding Zn ribbon protein
MYHLIMKHCQECNKQFEPTRHWQLFCSLKCRRHWYKEVRRRFVAMQADVGLLKGKKS